MYIPKSFSEDDPVILYSLMERYSFATLVTSADRQLIASHLPFILDAERGVLKAHLARANNQWQSFANDQEVLVIFQGPHAYVTPSWYEPDSSNVPTWNYAAVHAYGLPHIIDNPLEVYGMLCELVNFNEAGFEKPWQLEDYSVYEQRLLAVVAFEIEITRLEGKYKLSQNRNESDQRHVAEGLSSSASPLEVATGELMRERRGR
jgi:transcriptional regulator